MLERCRRGGATWVAAGLVWAGFSCAEDETRPGRVGDCNEPACLDSRGSAPPLSAPSSNNPDDGSGGAAGSGGMPGSGPGSLAGTVREVASADLVTSQSLLEAVQVRAPSATQNADDISAETGSGGMFRLDGIRQGTTLWVGVGSFADPPEEPFIDTLQAVDSTREDFVDLIVLQREVLRSVASAAFLLDPVEIDPEGAHIVIQFVDTDRRPIEGLELRFPDPATDSVAYDAGDTYSDALETTSTRGMAVVLNQRAARFPGSATTVVARLGDEEYTTNLQIAEGSVTVVTAVISAP